MIDPNLKNIFDDGGFVHCQNFVQATQVDEMIDNLVRLFKDVVPSMKPEHVFFEDKSNPNSLKQLQLLHEYDGYFGRLMSEGPFRALAESLLGKEVVCKNMQYFNKPAGIGRPTPAHQDGYYFKLQPCEALTMWLALEPVDEQNGCVRYIPGSHKHGMRPHGSTGTLGFSQGITDFPQQGELETERAFPARPGDVLAHHALTIHRADGNQSSNRSRQALGFIYYSVDARQDIAAWEKYQADLKRELKSADKI